MCLELFGRLFLDDVGVEPHSVLNEIGRFDVKEAKFRRDMEKLRNNHQKDLYIEEVSDASVRFRVSYFPIPSGLLYPPVLPGPIFLVFGVK